MARILIADNDRSSTELIAAHLAVDGHVADVARRADEALALAERQSPDLVLLEVMLPDMNGFETAARLRAQRSDASLPMLFVSSLVDQDSRNLALRTGADEFLTKPVDQTELRLRVRNLLNRGKLTRVLEERNLELLEAGRFRDDMTSMIIHDLKNPLTVILSNVEFVAESPEIRDLACREALQDAQIGGQRIMRLIANLLDLNRLEGGTLQLIRVQIPLPTMLARLVDQRALMARATAVSMQVDVAPGVEIHADTDLLTRVIENILDNAFRYAPRGGKIVLTARRRDRATELRIGNSGPPVPVESRQTIFEKYGQTGGKHGRMNLGLGLYFCRLAIEAHGGTLTLEQTAELPTVFAITIPDAAFT